MKDPDGAYESILDAAQCSLDDITGLSEREVEGLVEGRRQKLSEQASRWLEYGEYITFEIDTEAGTATVIPADS